MYMANLSGARVNLGAAPARAGLPKIFLEDPTLGSSSAVLPYVLGSFMENSVTVSRT